ncbi:hypothetical protein BC830DRAFT_1115855 [Chytriomyces sp. MP71]|nr:hypothetical protein BC830DRAFT_1115855 [Chytriomyces sp. MP71]
MAEEVWIRPSGRSRASAMSFPFVTSFSRLPAATGSRRRSAFRVGGSRAYSLSLSADSIKKIGVIGAGQMRSGIAQESAQNAMVPVL